MSLIRQRLAADTTNLPVQHTFDCQVSAQTSRPSEGECKNTSLVTNFARTRVSLVKVRHFRGRKQKKDTFLSGGGLSVKSASSQLKGRVSHLQPTLMDNLTLERIKLWTFCHQHMSVYLSSKSAFNHGSAHQALRTLKSFFVVCSVYKAPAHDS